MRNFLERQTAKAEVMGLKGILSGRSKHSGAAQEQQVMATELLHGTVCTTVHYAVTITLVYVSLDCEWRRVCPTSVCVSSDKC